MSFPKAKLTRFNEVNDSTPSPADYNPVDVKSRTPGCVISVKDRFNDEKTDDVSIQSGNSTCFRTPTPIKKRKPQLPKQPRNDDSEALKEKMVECTNKDIYIKELVEQIDELKDQVSTLKSHREIIERDCQEFRDALVEIEGQHAYAVEGIFKCCNAEKKKLDEQIVELSSNLRNLNKDQTSLRLWYESELLAMTDNIDEVDEKFTNVTIQYIKELHGKEAEVIAKEERLEGAQNMLKSIEGIYNNCVEMAHNRFQNEIESLQEEMRENIMRIKEKYVASKEGSLGDKGKIEELQKPDTNSIHILEKPNFKNSDISPKANLNSSDIPKSPKLVDVSEKSTRKPNKINVSQQTNDKELLILRHTTIGKSSKELRKPNLNMYTESFDSTDEAVDLQQAERGDGIHSILISSKQEQSINPKLKMKFYPIENIEDIDDTDRSCFDFSSGSNNPPNDYPEESGDKLQKDKIDSGKVSKQMTSNRKNIDQKDISQIIDENKAELMEFENKYKKSCDKIEKDLEARKNKEIHNLKTVHARQVATLKTENDTHLEQVKEDYKESIDLAKIQAEENRKDVELTYKIKLEEKKSESEAVLKECEAISEYTIRESKTEKEGIDLEIEKVNEDIGQIKWNENRCKYLKLIRKYEEAVEQFKTLEEKLLHDITLLDDEKKQYMNDNFTYHTTIHRMHETIEALTKRLFESDNDVEQLKTELRVCDTSKSQLEEKRNKLSEELDSLTRLSDDLEIQQESSLKVFDTEIKLLEENILQTVEGYKDSVSKIIKDYKTKLEAAEFDLQEVANCLYEQEILNSEAYNLIHLANVEIQDLEKNSKHLEDQICSIKIELARAKSQINDLSVQKKEIEGKLRYEQLQNEELKENLEKAKVKREETEILSKHINQLQEKSDSYYQYCEYYRNKANEYEKQIDEMNNVHRCYIDQSKEFESLLQKCEETESRTAELKRMVSENEVLIAPFRQQLEAYEYERQTLLTQKCDAENEARVMGLRYAEMLGHQNQKQKIKHIVDLKEKNLNLLKTNQMMDMKIHAQSKMIEKLKAELGTYSKVPKRATEANKENALHENYASPLRDRNQL